MRNKRSIGCMQDMFDAVYALEDADLIPKPNQAAYDIVLNKAGLDPNRAAMFEDSPQNLRVPHDIGMRTVGPWRKSRHPYPPPHPKFIKFFEPIGDRVTQQPFALARSGLNVG